MATKTYSEKLKSPRWQKKRLEIMNRDNFKCQLCKDSETQLHVHHLEYITTDPWDVDDKLLITLCSDCHLFVEELKKWGIAMPAESHVRKINKETISTYFLSHINPVDNSKVIGVFTIDKSAVIPYLTFDFLISAAKSKILAELILNTL